MRRQFLRVVPWASRTAMAFITTAMAFITTAPGLRLHRCRQALSDRSELEVHAWSPPARTSEGGPPQRAWGKSPASTPRRSPPPPFKRIPGRHPQPPGSPVVFPGAALYLKALCIPDSAYSAYSCPPPPGPPQPRIPLYSGFPPPSPPQPRIP
jgi:hypothetical protein